MGCGGAGKGMGREVRPWLVKIDINSLSGIVTIVQY